MTKVEPKQKPRTITVIAGVQRSDSGQVVMPGEIIEMHFPQGSSYFKLHTSKLLIALMDRAGPDIVNDQTHRHKIEDLNWSHRDVKTIEASIRELQQTTVELTTTDGEQIITKSGPILSHVVRRHAPKQTNEIDVEFSKTFREVVLRSNYWGTLQRNAAMMIESKYTLALYGIASLHAHRWKPYVDWSLKELRSRMMVDSTTLPRWQDFRRRALEPAIEEVNHVTDVHVTYEPLPLREDGQRRRVDGVRLWVRPKTSEEFRQMEEEAQLGRSGRADRRSRHAYAAAQQQLDLSVNIDKSFSEPIRRSLLG